MTKAWCIWCEADEHIPKHGYWWIHPICAERLMDVHDDIKSIKQMLEGVHARNRFEKDGKDRIEIITDFIKDMEDFRRRWENSMQLIGLRKSSIPPSDESEGILEAKL